MVMFDINMCLKSISGYNKITINKDALFAILITDVTTVALFWSQTCILLRLIGTYL